MVKIEKVEIPILIIGFNRPDLLLGLIEELRNLAPRKIYLSIDGPRQNFDNDQFDVMACRQLVKNIDWDCDVKINFSDSNYGVGVWPKKSIDWIFLTEDFALILEDDVRISISFYETAHTMLEMLKNNVRLFSICAWNIVESTSDLIEYDYLYSRYFSGQGGWVTSKDKWKTYKFEIKQINLKKIFKILQKNNYNVFMTIYVIYNLIMIKANKLKAWDYQVLDLCLEKDYINIIPTKNMAQNVGDGEKATHTNFLPYLDKYELDAKYIKHPPINFENIEYDVEYRKARVKMATSSALKKTINQLKWN